MRRDELEHLLRAASTVAERRDVVVLGSQAILGTYDEDQLPTAATMSVEADLAFINDDDLSLADRVVIIEGANTEPGRGLCLEAHDLVIAKLIAYREKDLEFAAALIGAGFVDADTLAERLSETSSATPIQIERVRVWLRRHSR